MLHILFVCTGNTCRSPMAEALLKKELSTVKLPFQVEVSSAGLSAFDGERAAAEVLNLLDREGISGISNFRSRGLDRSAVEESDLILVMTGNHKSQMLARFPSAAGKVFLLSEYAGCLSGKEIDDPIGQGLMKYRAVLEDIRHCLKNLIQKLKEGKQHETSNWQ